MRGLYRYWLRFGAPSLGTQVGKGKGVRYGIEGKEGGGGRIHSWRKQSGLEKKYRFSASFACFISFVTYVSFSKHIWMACTMYAEERRDATRSGAGWLHRADTIKSWKSIDVWGVDYGNSSHCHHKSILKMGYGWGGGVPCEYLNDGLRFGIGQKLEAIGQLLHQGFLMQCVVLDIRLKMSQTRHTTSIHSKAPTSFFY